MTANARLWVESIVICVVAAVLFGAGLYFLGSALGWRDSENACEDAGGAWADGQCVEKFGGDQPL